MSDTQEQETKPKKAKKRGRPTKGDYLTFEEARSIVRDEMIPSRSKYLEWWNTNKPKTLPRFPYRVYKDWVSWNDFLGTNNKFQTIGTKWRNFDEATVWAHGLKLGSQKEWLDWCRENKSQLPLDIPARPDMVYNKWTSWNHWLGNKAREAVEARQAAEKRKLFYIIRYPSVPTNVYSFGTEDAGLSGIKERWDREKFTVVRLFWFDPEQAIKVKQIIEHLSTSYQDNDRQRIVPNIFEIIYHLEMVLETARDPSV